MTKLGFCITLFLFMLLSVQQDKPELDQEKSSMKQKDTLQKGSSVHTEHDDVSYDDVSSTPWDGNAEDDISNAPTGPVTHSESKGQNIISKGFVIMSQGVDWLTTIKRMFPAGLERSKTSNVMNPLYLLKMYETNIFLFTYLLAHTSLFK